MKNLLICLLIFGFTLTQQSTLQAQNHQSLFQKGLIQEEGEGNLKAAIDIYNTIVNDNSIDRALRAKALLHVGICHEKLGNQNARTSYQKLISEYSDQKDIVSLGREKLKGLKKLDAAPIKEGIVASQVWSPAQDTYGVSPDGRYLNYIDWNNISLNLKDLSNGSTRVISPAGTWETPDQFPDNSIWSPDGKQLAYYWFVGYDTELHIVNVDGSSDRILAKGNRETGLLPITWSPDGKYILASTTNESGDEKSRKVVRVSVKDGSVTELKTLVNCGCYMDISPDGKYIVYAYPQSENSEQKDVYILSMDGSIDKKIVTDLANDDSPIWSRDGKEILFVSNRYGTNDLWKLKVENGNPIGAAEIVKVDLGRDYRLFHTTNNNVVFIGSSNSRFDIYTANINDNDNGAVKISSLNDRRNTNPSWSPDGRYVAFFRISKIVYGDLGNKYLLSLYDTKTKTRREIDPEIYSYSRKNKPMWSPDGKKLLLWGIKKENMEGGHFLYNIETGDLIPVKTKKDMTRSKLASSNNEFAYSNDGKSFFYISEDQKSILKYDIKSKQESTVYSGSKFRLYFKLSNDNSKIAFGHWGGNKKELYVVDTSGGEKKKIFEADCDCPPILISWSKDDKFVYYQEGNFRNLKKIMRVPANGGEPEEVYNFKDTFKNATIIRVDMHPDGKNISVQTEVGKGGEIWKFEGLFDQ